MLWLGRRIINCNIYSDMREKWDAMVDDITWVLKNSTISTTKAAVSAPPRKCKRTSKAASKSNLDQGDGKDGSDREDEPLSCSTRGKHMKA